MGSNMPPSQDMAAWYDGRKHVYGGYASEIKSLVEKLISSHDIPVHSITCRLKERDSFLKKCERKHYTDPVREMTDLSGVRIIAYTTSDVDKICALIEEEFSIDKKNSMDKAKILATDRVGYLSKHYVAKSRSNRSKLKEYNQFKNLPCEIQIRTMLQHAWAEIEHDRSYKFSGVLPQEIDRRFHLIAGVLEVVDTEFQRLSDEIDDYAESVKAETSKRNLTIPIDSISLMEYLKTKLSQYPQIEATFFGNDDTLIKELGDFEIHLLSDLEQIITDEMITGSAQKSVQNYTGFLRDMMIISDAAKYFAKAWKSQWKSISIEDVDYLVAHGVKRTMLEKYVDTVDKY